MRFLLNRFKNRLSEYTALQLLSWTIGIIAFLFMFAIRYKAVWHVDDIAYVYYMFKGTPVDLMLGRSGYMMPYIWLWKILLKFGFSFYAVEDIARIVNIVILAFSYVLFFKVLIAVRIPIRVAFITVLFIISEFSFSIISSRITDTPLMCLSIFASYLFFIGAHEQQKVRYLTISSLLFAYSFLVREPSIFYFPFFIVMLISYSRQNKMFTLKEYLKNGLLFLAVCISVPLVLFLVYGDIYIFHFKLNAPFYSFSYANLIHKLSIIGQSQLNLVTLPLSLVGLFIFAKDEGWRRALGFAIAGPFSISLFIFFSEEELLYEPRLYLGLFFFLYYGIAILVTYVADRISQPIIKKAALCVICAAVMHVTYIRYLHQYNDEIREVQELQTYYERIRPLLETNATLILGKETNYVRYRTMADKIEVQIIWPGVSWPAGRLVEQVNLALLNNSKVIYDPISNGYFGRRRHKDLQQMAETFKLTPIENGFIQVSLKN